MGTAAHLGSVTEANTRAYAGGTRWWKHALRRALPVLPNTLFQIKAVLSSSPANLGRLVAIVGDDPAMTANLLREAREVETESPSDHLVDIIIGLGVQRLQALLLRTSLLTTAEAKSSRYVAWRAHSGLTSVLAETIASTAICSAGRMARMAGLLHDIGHLPTILRDPAVRSAIALDCDSGTGDSGTATHCEVGRELARTWCFPDGLTDVISEHHTDPVPSASLINAVVAADRVSHRAGVGVSEQLTLAWGGKTLEEVLYPTLPWLTYDQQVDIASKIRSTYQVWRRSHPGLGFAEL